MNVTSSQNASLKRLRALYKDKKLRSEEGVFIAEGVNLVKDIPTDYSVVSLFIKESKESDLAFLEEKFDTEAYIVKDGLFDAVADQVTPSGVIALVAKQVPPARPKGDTVLLLDGISDAGNMGTIIRTAAARGIQTIICADCTDAFSPKCVRAAMSGTFRVSIIETTLSDALSLLCGYSIIGLDMDGECIYGYKKGDKKIAIAVGNEAHGLSKETREVIDEKLSIPMENGMESLNAAVSAGIAMYLIR